MFGMDVAALRVAACTEGVSGSATTLDTYMTSGAGHNTDIHVRVYIPPCAHCVCCQPQEDWLRALPPHLSSPLPQLLRVHTQETIIADDDKINTIFDSRDIPRQADRQLCCFVVLFGFQSCILAPKSADELWSLSRDVVVVQLMCV